MMALVIEPFRGTPARQGLDGQSGRGTPLGECLDGEDFWAAPFGGGLDGAVFSGTLVEEMLDGVVFSGTLVGEMLDGAAFSGTLVGEMLDGVAFSGTLFGEMLDGVAFSGTGRSGGSLGKSGVTTAWATLRAGVTTVWATLRVGAAIQLSAARNAPTVSRCRARLRHPRCARAGSPLDARAHCVRRCALAPTRAGQPACLRCARRLGFASRVRASGVARWVQSRSWSERRAWHGAWALTSRAASLRDGPTPRQVEGLVPTGFGCGTGGASGRHDVRTGNASDGIDNGLGNASDGIDNRPGNASDGTDSGPGNAADEDAVHPGNGADGIDTRDWLASLRAR